jgi:hypothetical protein
LEILLDLPTALKLLELSLSPLVSLKLLELNLLKLLPLTWSSKPATSLLWPLS